ncbi:TPA: hypothetical protein ACNDLB_004675, partial [Shigella sonnei]
MIPLKKNITLIMFTLSLLTGNPAIAYETDKVYKITVLHTNDHHGHFW